MFKRILWIVLDSVGCGNAPDASSYGDEGSNTLLHVYQEKKPNLDNLASIGLFKILDIDYKKKINLCGAYGSAIEASAGKDTTTGHWEMAGLLINKPFPTFPNGFPDEVMSKFDKITGTSHLGNCVASGTEIIERLGDEHVRTGYPIVYTSADSVFQIACDEEIYPIERLYDICRQTRNMLTGDYAVGRVIARPFIKKDDKYVRTKNRQDFSLDPLSDTILDILDRNGVPTYGVGKIEDIFNHRGLTYSDHAHGNTECLKATHKALSKLKEGLIFTNLVDFDMVYGHRRDVEGYSKALEEFDIELGNIMKNANDDDLIIITADHGCDPTYKGTDHTREQVPVLVWHKNIRGPINLGIRKSYRDMAATIAENFKVKERFDSNSFLNEII